jgi:hypothetical protein
MKWFRFPGAVLVLLAAGLSVSHASQIVGIGAQDCLRFRM